MIDWVDLVGEGVRIRRRGKKSIYLDDQLRGARGVEVGFWERLKVGKKGLGTT